MKVSVYSRAEVEKMIADGNFPKNIAVISFYDPKIKHIDSNYDCVNYYGIADEVFYSELDDLDIGYLTKKGLTYDVYFPEVDELAEYIYSIYSKGMDIICQCEYGQSRSAGCAAAILQHFYGTGIDIFADYRRYPNQVVYHKVFDALKKFSEKKETLMKVFPYGRNNYKIGDKKQMFEVINKGLYKDMQPRHFGGIGAQKAEREKIFHKLVDKFCDYFSEKPMNMEEYDNWHKNLSNWIYDEFDKIGYGDKLTRGKAQKLINMSMKNFYLFSNSNEEYFTYAHVALDQYILYWYTVNCPVFEGLKKEWGSFDDNVYQTIQDNIRKYLNTGGNTRFSGMSPFKAEFYIWNEYKEKFKNFN